MTNNEATLTLRACEVLAACAALGAECVDVIVACDGVKYAMAALLRYFALSEESYYFSLPIVKLLLSISRVPRGKVALLAHPSSIAAVMIEIRSKFKAKADICALAAGVWTALVA